MSIFTKALKKSIWVYHMAASPCNNCDIEILDLLTPRFDVERFGILPVGSPRHADALLITGYINRHVAPRVVEVYEQTPKPCVVFAVGTCACSMGIFAKSYNAAGPLDKLIRSVDPDALIVYVPGCPPKPEAIISAVVKAISAL